MTKVIGVAIAWPVMIALLTATIVVRVRPRGGSLRKVLGVRRELSRRRLATDEQVLRRAPIAAAALGLLGTPTAFLAIPGADGNAPSQAGAWVALFTVPAAGLAVWVGLDRWLRPGTVIRVLRRDAFVAGSVLIMLALATTTSLAAILKLQRPGIWFTLYLAQMGWLVGSAICGFRLAARRKKKAA